MRISTFLLIALFLNLDTVFCGHSPPPIAPTGAMPLPQPEPTTTTTTSTEPTTTTTTSTEPTTTTTTSTEPTTTTTTSTEPTTTTTTSTEPTTTTTTSTEPTTTTTTSTEPTTTTTTSTEPTTTTTTSTEPTTTTTTSTEPTTTTTSTEPTTTTTTSTEPTTTTTTSTEPTTTTTTSTEPTTTTTTLTEPTTTTTTSTEPTTTTTTSTEPTTTTTTPTEPTTTTTTSSEPTTTTTTPPLPCSSSPCKNSGTCANKGSSFSCSCTAWYEGNQCAKDRCDHTHFSSTLPDIVFIVDGSTGIGKDYFIKALEYIDKFVSYFNVGPSYFQFSVITYSFNATVEFNLRDHWTISTLRTAITNINYTSGPSYTGAGLRMARTEIFSKSTSGKRSDRPGHAIIISDGMSSNLVETQDEATSLKISGIEVAAVAIGPQILHQELLDIASHVLHVYTSTNTDLMHHIYRKYAPLCPACATKYADVEILLEVSKDLTRKEFHTLVTSLKFLLQIMNIGSSKIRVSLSHIWSELKMILSSDSYNDIDTLLADAITAATQKSGSTNASKAFEHVIQNGFPASRGDRNVLILFSTGRFSDNDCHDVKTKAEAIKSSSKAVNIVTVGAGLNSNVTNLMAIVSDPAFYFLIGDDVYMYKSSLQALLSTLEFDVCSGYLD